MSIGKLVHLDLQTELAGYAETESTAAKNHAGALYTDKPW